MKEPEVIPASRVRGRAVHALHRLLMSLPLAERRELRLKLRAAYLADPAKFVAELPDDPFAVESVRRWRRQSS